MKRVSLSTCSETNISSESPIRTAPALTERGKQSLLEAFDPRSNALNALRLLFAFMVIVGHSSTLGFNRAAPRLGSLDYQDMPVDGFFVISGFLITRSRLQSKTGADYVKKRFLRIYPGYWVALLVGAFVFGPLIWVHENDRPLVDYFTTDTENPFAYLVTNVTIFVHQYGVSGLLTHASPPNAINGSIWTLVYEVIAYLCVALFAIVGVLHRRKFVTAVAAALLISYFLVRTNLESIMSSLGVSHHIQDPFRLGLMFTVGMAFYLWAGRIPLNDLVAAISVGVVALSGMTDDWRYCAAPAFAYLVLWAAIRLPPTVKKIGRRNDLSYGLYLYGWPVQELLWTYGIAKYGMTVFVVSAMALASVCAVLSWRFVEAPALRRRTVQADNAVVPATSALEVADVVPSLGI